MILMFLNKVRLHNTTKIGLRHFKKATAYEPKYNQATYPEATVSELENGMKVACENWRTPTCTVGLWMDIGSRCESDSTSGTAKFMEHMYFKGTGSRDQKKIQTEVLERGATLSAYTTRETIAIYANCQKKDVDWAVSLLAEIVGDPKYSEDSFEKEKCSVLAELTAVESNYRNVVMDYIHAAGFQETPLSRSIYGNEENVRNMTLDDLYNFNKGFYKAPKMVLAGVGDLSHYDLESAASKYMKGISCNYELGIDERQPIRFIGSEVRDRDDALPLAHCAVAFQGPGAAYGDAIRLRLAAAINGSYDKTYGGAKFNASRFAAKGFSNPHLYSYENFYIQYHDTSLWGLYFTGDGGELLATTEAIMPMVMRTCTNITELEVNRAKNQLLTNLMLSMDSTRTICDQIGRQVLWYGRRMSIDEMIKRVQEISVEELRETLMTYVYDRCPAVASYGPNEGFPQYITMRGYSWWMRY